MTGGLKPFWRYYGGKWRAAPHYPKPVGDTIVEPFAGAAGYSMRYPHLKIVLVEKYPVVAELWRFLIAATHADIMSIPLVDSVDDLPDRVPLGGRHLVGFAMNAATVSPCKNISAGRVKLRDTGQVFEGWSEQMRDRVARQVPLIKHWVIVEGDYTAAPDVRATWFIDPPYDNKAGSYYVHSRVDYAALAEWAMERRNCVIACENEGATWLPFEQFKTLRAGLNGKGSKEVIFHRQWSFAEEVSEALEALS